MMTNPDKFTDGHIYDACRCNYCSRIELFSHKSKCHRWDPSSLRLSPSRVWFISDIIILSLL